MALKPKPKTARAVQANRGVRAAYHKRLSALVDRLTASVERSVVAQYRKAPPRALQAVQDVAGDARPPAEFMRLRIAELRKDWERQFDESAETVAETYMSRMFRTTDNAFMAALKDAGWAVKFEMTPAMKDAFNATVGENVGLIKSIPAEYLDRVEGAVMRGYTAGRDLQSITEELRALYPITANRAALIARDQCNKANATVNRTRQMELGITRAVWMHSHAGKHPRPGHLAADGKEFDVAKGCYIDGEYIQPGEQINCRCSSRAVLPF
jgi:uncharacterized protein with gpF-like domain